MALVYRKPFAALFTDEPPEPLEDLPDLRRLFHILRDEGAQVTELLPDIAEAVGEALARRDIYNELAVNAPAFRLTIDPEQDLDEVALELRGDLSVSWSEQAAIRNDNEARRFWTAKVEAIGVLVFQFTAPMKQARGFAVGSGRPPIVAVNSGDAEYGRTFSIVHELVHVALPVPTDVNEIQI